MIATALEAFGKAQHDFSKNYDFVELAEKYGRGNINNIQADQYRYTLKRLINNSWKKKDVVVTSVVQRLPCFVRKGIIEDKQGLLKVSTVGCEKERECSIAPEIQREDKRCQKAGGRNI